MIAVWVGGISAVAGALTFAAFIIYRLYRQGNVMRCQETVYRPNPQPCNEVAVVVSQDGTPYYARHMPKED